MTALRKFIEVDNHEASVSVKLLDQHRVVKELVGRAIDTVDHKGATVKQGPEELTLRIGSKVFCGHHED